MATINGGGSTTTLSLGSNEATQVAVSVQGAVNAALAAGTLTRTSSPTVAAASGQGLAQIVTSGAYALPTTTTGLIVSPGSVSATVTGSSASNNSVLVDTTVSQFAFNTNGGSGSIVTGDGNNLIGTNTTNFASYFIQTGAGNDTIVAFTGFNTVSAGGGNNLIGTGTTGTQSNNVIFASGNDTITGGAGRGTDVVIAGAGTEFVNPGSKNLTFIGTTGTATIIGGTGQEFVALGTGGGQAGGGSGGANLLYGADGLGGSSTLFGGANGDILFARGGAGTVLVAGVGNETLQGGASLGADTFFIGTGNDVIGLGFGSDTVVSNGTGNAVINIGTALDTVRFINRAAGSTANVVINNFGSGSGQIQLVGYGGGKTGGVAAATVVGGSQIVTLTDGTKITFVGSASGNASNFI